MHDYGANLTTALVTNQNKQSVSVSNNYQLNGTAVIVYTVDYGNQSLLPTINSVHPTLTGYILTNIEGEELPGGLFRATCTYTNYFQTLPATTYVEQSCREDAPIQEHPNFPTWQTNGWWDSANQRFNSSAPQDLQGATSYVSGSTTVVMTEYFDSMPSSRHTDIGMLEVPDSEYGTYQNWLIIASTRQQQNSNWIRTTTYQYSAVGWSTDIYSAT